MKAVFDTNIIIDCMKKVPMALEELKRHKQHYISIISSIELLVGATDYQEERNIRKFMQRFDVVPLSQDIADIAAVIRKEKRLKLPDAVILATAEHLGISLVTRNSKDFLGVSPLVKIPYHVH